MTDYYCQMHDGEIRFKIDGRFIGICPCDKKLKNGEKCAECFTEKKESPGI